MTKESTSKVERKPVWFDLKSYYPRKFGFIILVVLDQKCQMVVDEVLLLLALEICLYM
jgi:hypothetical protein